MPTIANVGYLVFPSIPKTGFPINQKVRRFIVMCPTS
jgi:hypothetical protein